MHQQSIKKSAKIKGLSWGLFSGTATFSAFTLPAFIFGIVGHNLFDQNNRLWYPPIWALKVFAGITLFCAIYHSLYRVKTITFDLGFSPRIVKTVGIITNILLVTEILAIMLLLITG